MRERWALLGSMLAFLFHPAWAAHAGVTIEVGTAIGAAGRPAYVEVVLRAPDASVAGAQNDLTFDPLTPVAIRQGGTARPFCALSDALGTTQYTPFAFVPAGCVPGRSCDVRALVLSLASVNPLPDGTVLYTCRVDVDSAAPPGSYPIRCANPGAADVQGAPLPATCTDGAVQVVEDLATPTATPTRPPTLTPTPTETGTPCAPACPAVRVATATARAGERVPLAVRLDAHGQGIAGVQADLGFDRHVPVAARDSGAPDCQVNRSLGPASIISFSFQPPTCTGSDCVGVRAIVSLAEAEAIPDGAEIFTCTVDVRGDAPPGAYEVPVSHVQGTTAGGAPVTMTGQAGAVVVAADSAAGGGGGCQTGPAGDQAAWPVSLALVVVSLACRRRARAFPPGGRPPGGMGAPAASDFFCGTPHASVEVEPVEGGHTMSRRFGARAVMAAIFGVLGIPVLLGTAFSRCRSARR